MADVLVDTTSASATFSGRSGIRRSDAQLGYSVITRAEPRAGARTDGEFDAIRRLLGVMTEFPVDRRIADEAGGIRAEHNVRLPDALLAATASIPGLVVHTFDASDVRLVAGLRVHRPR